jgi:hypothetical protein
MLVFPLDLPSFAFSAALREMFFLLVCFPERKGLYPVGADHLGGNSEHDTLLRVRV